MTNKLLEEIKKRDLSHEKALEIIDKYIASQGSDEEEEEEEEENEEEEEPEGTPDDPDKKKKKKKQKKEGDKEKGIDVEAIKKEITKAVSETVGEELKKQLKKLRGAAPKGEETDDPFGKDQWIKKNLFEKIV